MGLTFRLENISASNREPDARAYFADVPELFEYAAALSAPHHVSVSFHGFYVAVFIRRGKRDADVRERENNNVASLNVSAVRFLRLRAVVLRQAPIFKTPCASRSRSFECRSLADSRGLHRLADYPTDKRAAPRPRLFRVEIRCAFVFIHSRAAVCSVDFLNSNFVFCDAADFFA